MLKIGLDPAQDAHEAGPCPRQPGRRLAYQAGFLLLNFLHTPPNAQQPIGVTKHLALLCYRCAHSYLLPCHCAIVVLTPTCCLASVQPLCSFLLLPCFCATGVLISTAAYHHCAFVVLIPTCCLASRTVWHGRGGASSQEDSLPWSGTHKSTPRARLRNTSSLIALGMISPHGAGPTDEREVSALTRACVHSNMLDLELHWTQIKLAGKHHLLTWALLCFPLEGNTYSHGQ